jgi:uncharacterized protein
VHQKPRREDDEGMNTLSHPDLYPDDRSDPVIDCRPGCAACCIAPSIASPLPGMPHGKPAGMPCVHLDDDLGCRLFGRPERPAFCAGLQPRASMCGRSREEAMEILHVLELATRP